MSPEAMTFAGVCVTAVGALLTTVIVQVSKTGSDNRRDHAKVRVAIDRLDGTVAGLVDDVKEMRADIHEGRDEQRQHLRWHLDHQAAEQNGHGR